MPLVCHYKMCAAPGKSDSLGQELASLAEQIHGVPGCIGVEVLQYVDNSEVFLLTEYWATAEAHTTSSRQLPKEAFNRVKAMLDNPPQVTRLVPYRLASAAIQLDL